MSSPLIPIKANVEVPMKESCNCFDKFTCNFICCDRRAKSPTMIEEKKVEQIDKLSKEIMDNKQKKDGK